ncbi:acyltransferase [Mesorhizobium muleiense]|uniref:acyltransferase family protein n=1 Tax=Mesorhizobium muleiense TaxID=1004279 RepID=UPI001F48BAB7|nr:acyltransferase [Mesorhizobium muleiense]MCF6117305.1 acyltransferase [Mesorhizobium muleiense]
MRDRNEVIDGFRGIAILSVMAYHFLLRWKPVTGLEMAVPSWVSLGKFGVEVFFVISGLVITMTVLRSANALEFGVRRLARLYPAFIVASTGIFVLIQIAGPIGPPISVADYIINFSMMARELGFEYVDGVFWSLAVEVKFYAWVFLCFLLLGTRFWIGLLCLSIAAWLVSLVSFKIGTYVLIAPYLPLFLAGMAVWLGRFENRVRDAWIVSAVAFVLYVLNAGFFETDHASQTSVQMYIIGVSAAMIALLIFAPRTRMGPLAWVGRISYSLYLIHQFLGITIIRSLKVAGANDVTALGIAVVVCIVLAALSYRFIEGPGAKAIMSLYRMRFTPAVRTA